MPDYEVVDANDQTQTLSFADDPPEETTLQAAVTALEALDDALQSNGSDSVQTAIQSIASPSSVEAGEQSVSSPGTAEALAGSSTPITEGVQIRAVTNSGANTGNIFVGGSGVSAGSGYILEPGDRVYVVVDDLASVYIDAANSGDGVCYMAS